MDRQLSRSIIIVRDLCPVLDILKLIVCTLTAADLDDIVPRLSGSRNLYILICVFNQFDSGSFVASQQFFQIFRTAGIFLATFRIKLNFFGVVGKGIPVGLCFTVVLIGRLHRQRKDSLVYNQCKRELVLTLSHNVEVKRLLLTPNAIGRAGEFSCGNIKLKAGLFQLSIVFHPNRRSKINFVTSLVDSVRQVSFKRLTVNRTHPLAVGDTHRRRIILADGDLNILGNIGYTARQIDGRGLDAFRLDLLIALVFPGSTHFHRIAQVVRCGFTCSQHHIPHTKGRLYQRGIFVFIHVYPGIRNQSERNFQNIAALFQILQCNTVVRLRYQ